MRRVSVLPNRRRRSRSGVAADSQPTDEELGAILASPERVASARRDLADLGFFHRLLKEPCARAWNREDGVKGHFWEGRFLSPPVLDGPSLMHVARYVELNEVRACASASISSSVWTSARLQWNRLVSSIRGVLAQQRVSVEVDLDRIAWQPVFPCRTAAQHPSNANAPRATADAPTTSLVDYLSQLECAGRVPHPRKPGRISQANSCLIDAVHLAARPNGSRSIPLRDAIMAVVSSRLQHWLRPVEPAALGLGREQAPHRQYGSCFGEPAAIAAEANRRGASRIVAIQISS